MRDSKFERAALIGLFVFGAASARADERTVRVERTDRQGNRAVIVQSNNGRDESPQERTIIHGEGFVILRQASGANSAIIIQGE
ncbi:MAG: hypothetical protein KGL46_00180 [Hyphomicrobiales bacterium]|nr:hypothetical protein [Hyphomicrobiales bacterium]